MPLFKYRALDDNGQYRKGDWFGACEKDLYNYLRKQNLRLISCRPLGKFSNYFSLFRPVPLEHLINFCIHMEQLDKIKMPLTEAVLLSAETLSSNSFKIALMGIHHHINQGMLLSEACRSYPEIFDEIFVQCLSTGEQTGHLPQSFAHLREHLEWKKKQQMQIKQAVRYPLLLLCILIALISFMVGIVSPHLKGFLAALGTKNEPLALTALTSLAYFFETYAFIFFPFLLVFYGIYLLCLKVSPSFYQKMDAVKLRMPLWGPLKKNLLLGNFLHTLSILLSENLDLITSLEKAIHSTANCFLRKKLTKIFDLLKKGQPLSQALASTQLFKNAVLRSVALGESTGNLAFLLKQISSFERDKSLKQAQSLLTWTEPVLIIIMGVIMAWIVAATVVPLYDNLALFDL